jgi:hypothetical protein
MSESLCKSKRSDKYLDEIVGFAARGEDSQLLAVVRRPATASSETAAFAESADFAGRVSGRPHSAARAKARHPWAVSTKSTNQKHSQYQLDISSNKVAHEPSLRIGTAIVIASSVRSINRPALRCAHGRARPFLKRDHDALAAQDPDPL